jgi:single-strand DNA-binding protein
MDITGRIKLIKDEQSFPSGFVKREFVVTTEEQYPQDIQLELIKDKTSLVSNYNAGDRIKVFFNIRGSEYNGRYFVNLQAWKIENALAGSSESAPASATSAPAPAAASFAPPVDDDLPF